MALNKLLRIGDAKRVRALADLVPEVNALEPGMQALSNDELAAKTIGFRGRLADGETLEDILLEAFAVVREASLRVLGQRHYDVQIMGGAALHFGWTAEMKTGEGKTLVATLPVYLNALAGRGTHVVTVNDYLASRDAATMGQVYNFLGLSVGLLTAEDHLPDSRREQYLCDITYGTNKEFGFDYLRDNMVRSVAEKVQRGHYYAVVDEVDSILIDEARTPLIIAGTANDSASLYYKFAAIVRSMKNDVHYDVDEKKRQVAPTEEGVALVEKALGVEHLYDEASTDLVHHLQAALKAKELHLRDKDYVVKDGQIQIVDEFTGRILDGRRWSNGLHQAVEAKEGVTIQAETHTMASVTLQNYFRMYEKLAGMTGTAQTEASELFAVYGMHVVSIPTHQPMIRFDQKDLVFGDEDSKFASLVKDLEERHRRGQPVLVGTVSVEKNQKLSSVLSVKGIPHEILNAKEHHREAEIIAQAGRLHAVTVATNMAGRGVDIILGGNPEMLAAHELNEEIASGKNGLDGSDDEAVEQRLQELVALKKAECGLEGDAVRDLGGLYVLGTERHESRRIDNQLRGRSGRQGDPGESRFYLSLEDDLMRVFANAKAVSWAFQNATADGAALESKSVSKVVEKAQTTIEQSNAEIRRNVVKYDDVMNEQRKAIYKKRDQILAGESLRETLIDGLSDSVDEMVGTYCVPADIPEDWDISGLLTEAKTLWPCHVTTEDLTMCSGQDAAYELLMGDALSVYESKEAEFGEEALREVERQVMLSVLDRNWLEHLEAMDYLREGIQWRATAQKDPLHEWQRDGFDMFEAMVADAKKQMVAFVLHTEKTDPATVIV